MFNEGGQPLRNVVCRGGGKGGGGGSNPMMEYYLMQKMQEQNPATAAPQTYTDATTGQIYSDLPSYNAAIAKDKSDADAAAAQKESTFQTNKGTAYNNALNNIMQTFKGQGVDPNDYMSYITPALAQASGSIPDLATDFTSYFPAGLGATILNQALGDKRTGLTNQLNQTFSPTYASTQLPSSLSTDAVNKILSEKFDPLSTELQNAQKRGTLTPAGYTAALAKLGQDRSSAESQLNTLGSNILTGDRSALDTLASGARSDISGMSLGQKLDPTSYVNQANTLVQQDVSGFPGALESAAGNVTFADIQDLINAGGTVQGANNPTAANPNALPGAGGTGAIGAGGGAGPGGTIPGTAVDDPTKRGLGSTGAF